VTGRKISARNDPLTETQGDTEEAAGKTTDETELEQPEK